MWAWMTAKIPSKAKNRIVMVKEKGKRMAIIIARIRGKKKLRSLRILKIKKRKLASPKIPVVANSSRIKVDERKKVNDQRFES